MAALSVRARALLQLANIRRDDFEAAIGLAESALADAADDDRLAVRIESLLAELCGNHGEADAGRHSHAAVERAERSGDAGMLAQALALTHYIHASLTASA